MEKYRVFEGKKLRYGYTTGTCAAAAAKAAAEMLFSKQRVDYVMIDTPKGISLNLEVEDVTINEGGVSCAIRKDAGDDPDDTNGILIYATVSKRSEEGTELLGGVGVGKDHALRAQLLTERAVDDFALVLGLNPGQELLFGLRNA